MLRCCCLQWRGEGEAEQEPEGNSGKSTSPEMTQSVTLTLRKPTTNSDAESGREQTLQDQVFIFVLFYACLTLRKL